MTTPSQNPTDADWQPYTWQIQNPDPQIDQQITSEWTGQFQAGLDDSGEKITIAFQGTGDVSPNPVHNDENATAMAVVAWQVDIKPALLPGTSADDGSGSSPASDGETDPGTALSNGDDSGDYGAAVQLLQGGITLVPGTTSPQTDSQTHEQGTTAGQSTDQGTTTGQSTDQGTTTGQSTDQGTTTGQSTDQGTTTSKKNGTSKEAGASVGISMFGPDVNVSGSLGQSQSTGTGTSTSTGTQTGTSTSSGTQTGTSTSSGTQTGTSDTTGTDSGTSDTTAVGDWGTINNEDPANGVASWMFHQQYPYDWTSYASAAGDGTSGTDGTESGTGTDPNSAALSAVAFNDDGTVKQLPNLSTSSLTYPVAATWEVDRSLVETLPGKTVHFQLTGTIHAFGAFSRTFTTRAAEISAINASQTSEPDPGPGSRGGRVCGLEPSRCPYLETADRPVGTARLRAAGPGPGPGRLRAAGPGPGPGRLGRAGQDQGGQDQGQGGYGQQDGQDQGQGGYGQDQGGRTRTRARAATGRTRTARTRARAATGRRSGQDQGQGGYGQDPDQGQGGYGPQDPDQGQGGYGPQDPDQGQGGYGPQDPDQGQGGYGPQDPGQYQQN